METICRFLPPKELAGNIKTVYFVYEADFATLKQPFFRPIHYVHLVTSGKATLRFGGNTYPLAAGSLFFFFPAVPYEIDGDKDFRFAYISFMGAGAAALLDSLGITYDRAVFDGFSHLIELWLSSIVRINQTNANLLTESVLLNTLSYISKDNTRSENNKNSENLFCVLVDYVDTHYRESGLTLRSVADIFSYTEKYLSHFFKSKMGVGFNEYLNNLRLQHARALIQNGQTSVSTVAAECGFSDPLYFSKAFKKNTGFSPREYMRNL